MKVLHVIGGVAWRYGGTTATVLSLCEALARRSGVSVEIAATDADGPGARLTSANTPPASVPLRLFRRDCSERWKLSVGLFRWLRKHIHEYDLIHIHGVWSFAGTAAAWAARRSRVPYVVLPQGMLSPYTWQRSSRTKWLYWLMVERRNLARASLVIVTSTGERTEVAELGLPTPIATLPLGVDQDAWHTPTNPDLLRQMCRSQHRGRPIILYMSRLHPKKGLAEFLLPAMKAMKQDAFLAVVGGPDPYASGYPDHVRAEIKRLGLSDQVALLGPAAPADRWAMFDGADVFALPSQNENFGLVVTEAMARGCPVVVSSEAHSCEHVTAAAAGIVIPLSVPKIAAALDSVLGNPNGRIEMSRRGREHAAHLGWDKIATDLTSLYASCISRESRFPIERE